MAQLGCSIRPLGIAEDFGAVGPPLVPLGVGGDLPVGDGGGGFGGGEGDGEPLEAVVGVDGELAVCEFDDVGFFVLLQQFGVADVEVAAGLAFGEVVEGEPVVAGHGGVAFAHVDEDGDVTELFLPPEFDGAGEACRRP